MVSLATTRRVMTRGCEPQGSGNSRMACAEWEHAALMIGKAGHVTAGKGRGGKLRQMG